MHTALVIIQVLVSAGVIGLVLLQQGKGADAGAAFGAGASGTVFGARGSATFLSRATGVLAALFMLASLALAYLVNDRAKSDSVVDRLANPPAAEQSLEPTEGASPSAVPSAEAPADDKPAPAPIPE